MAQEKRWLRVIIKDGLFPSERTVYFKTSEGEEVSAFVVAAQIDEAHQRMTVTLLDEDEKYALIQVPSQGGTSTAKIPKESISMCC
jgi:hypothetical protein